MSGSIEAGGLSAEAIGVLILPDLQSPAPLKRRYCADRGARFGLTGYAKSGSIEAGTPCPSDTAGWVSPDKVRLH